MLTAPDALRTLSEALFSPERSFRLTSAREGRSWSFHWQQPLMMEYLRERGNSVNLRAHLLMREVVQSVSCFGFGVCVCYLDAHSVLEQLEGFFRLFPRWWNCRSSLTEISANGASPGEKMVNVVGKSGTDGHICWLIQQINTLWIQILYHIDVKKNHYWYEVVLFIDLLHCLELTNATRDSAVKKTIIDNLFSPKLRLNLPSAAISYSKMPNDQLDRETQRQIMISLYYTPNNKYFTEKLAATFKKLLWGK